MCFVVSRYCKEEKVAKEDILAFKFLLKRPNALLQPETKNGVWFGPHTNYKYDFNITNDFQSNNLVKNKHYKEEIFWINEGLHCYRKINAQILNFYHYHRCQSNLFAVMIPKGSKYYWNGDEIVSSKLIFLGKIERVLVFNDLKKSEQLKEIEKYSKRKLTLEV